MPDPFVGTWILNTEKSQFDPNHRPRAGTLVFELDSEGYYVTRAEGVNEKGEKCAERPGRFIPDGEWRPVPDFPGLKAIATRTDPNTITGECRREDGSVVGGGTHVVSLDEKTLTVTNFGWDTQLRQFKQQTVWDRQ